MIIHGNLVGDESLAPEKLCTILFGTGRLKITMKCHAAVGDEFRQSVAKLAAL